MISQNLPASWIMRPVDSGAAQVPSAVRARGDIPATVPGCVHTDLLAADLIPDPYYDRNEAGTHWIGETGWSYRTTFPLAAGLLDAEHVELCCDGLDTVARVLVNGREVGRSRNMHTPVRFPVKDALRPGDNEIEVIFDAPLPFIREAEAAYGKLVYAGAGDQPQLPFSFIRKMACNFGWDWGPALVTCGIWRAIRLEAWSTGRVAHVRAGTKWVHAGRALVEVAADFVTAGNAALTVAATLRGPDGRTWSREVAFTPAATDTATLAFEISDPELWWPVGSGAQPLYELTVTISRAGTALQAVTRRIGIRTVELDCSPDGEGSRFQFRINGRTIYARGANWIPDDCFVSRITPERYRRRIDQAVAANMNMLRVWGGGIYEDDAFYDHCDERGVLVWQDFAFACAFYPETPEYAAEVEAEARANVARLMGHPSLALLCGNNECLDAATHWGWKAITGDIPWGAAYYFDLLPRVCAELSIDVPYRAGSPYSGNPEKIGGQNNHGDRHVWHPWNNADYTHYAVEDTRFCSEFGWIAPPTFATLADSIPADQRQPESASMQHHQRCHLGVSKLSARFAESFRPTEIFEDWVYLTQLNQAHALTFAVDHWRTVTPRCMGTLYWQLNDCWPVTSWATIDGNGRPKLGWFATRRFFAPRRLAFRESAAGVSLHAANDDAEPWSSEVVIERRTFRGELRATLTVPLACGSITTARVTALPTTFTHQLDRKGEFLLARTADGATARFLFAKTKDLAFGASEYRTFLVRDGAAWAFTVEAITPLFDVCLFPDLLDPAATVDDQLVDLLPGERHTFRVTSAREFGQEELGRTLRCLNAFGGVISAARPGARPRR